MNARKKSFFTSGDYRYTERRIHHGEDLYALGSFRTVGPDADRQSIKQSVSKLLNVWKGQQEALLKKFDVNQDGYDDLLMVGNDYGIEVNQGRMDALQGLVLINAPHKTT